jgi:hypothetical protein
VTGCFNLRGNLEVGRDAKISGKLTGEINKQLAAMAGITSKDALVAQMDGKESIHHGNQNVELIDCCDITEFWQQQLLGTQDPITWAVEALSPIVQPENT